MHIDAPVSPGGDETKDVDFFDEAHHSPFSTMGQTIRPTESSQSFSADAQLAHADEEKNGAVGGDGRGEQSVSQ